MVEKGGVEEEEKEKEAEGLRELGRGLRKRPAYLTATDGTHFRYLLLAQTATSGGLVSVCQALHDHLPAQRRSK
ncbi:Hypothetical predicted protein [Xyrichtys novacula]|uniref:Uncharacterized protein n=1 Tax=Xyrichtys novacula TaxID=13765 RepID=A0AAV1H3S0_XYRNO|nr:Hypothetical predicted protein [Xyrichtys novacula]